MKKNEKRETKQQIIRNFFQNFKNFPFKCFSTKSFKKCSKPPSFHKFKNILNKSKFS